VPLIKLIVALLLHTLLPPIVPIVISAVVAIIGGGRESLPSLPMSASSSSPFVVIVQLIVTFSGAIVGSIVVVTIMAIASGVPVIIAITSGAALSLMGIATSVVVIGPASSSSTLFC
jgi:hypothetical protein